MTRDAQRAVNRVLFYTAKLWGGLSLVAILLASLSPAAQFHSSLLAFACIAVVTVLWLALVFLPNPARWPLVVACSVAACVMVLNTAPAALAGTFAPAMAWTTLAAVMAAFLLRPRYAKFAVLGVGAATAVLVLLTVPSPLLGPALIQTPLLGVVSGMAAAAAGAALYRTARDSDAASDSRARARGLKAREQARLEESGAIAATIHDTVLNTLGAVGMGVRPENTGLLRSRCRYDLTQIDRIGAGAPRVDTDGPVSDGLNWIHDSARRRADSLGLTIELTTDGNVAKGVPVAVLDAICGAIDEALLNVSKHANVSTAQLITRYAGGTLSVEVRDRGVGFDGIGSSQFGLESSIMRRCARAGVLADITSSAGGGSDVRMQWKGTPAIPEQVSEDAGPPIVLRDAMTPLVSAFAGWFAFFAVVVGIVGLSVRQPMWVFAPLALFLAVGTGIVLAVRRGKLGVAWMVVLIAATFIVTVSSAQGAVGCTAAGFSWWGNNAGLAMALLVILLGRNWRWWAAGTFAYSAAMIVVAIQMGAACGGDVITLLVTNLPALVAVMLFRFVFDKHRSAAELQVDKRDRDLMEHAATAQRLAVRQQRVAQDLAQARSLLIAIADDAVNPLDPVLQQRAASEAHFLRAIIELDAEPGDLEVLLGEAVRRAYANGARLTLGLVQQVGPIDEPLREELAGVLAAVVATLPYGSAARLTTSAAGAVSTISIVGDAWWTPAALPSSANISVLLDSNEDNTAVELSWSCSPGPQSPASVNESAQNKDREDIVLAS